MQTMTRVDAAKPPILPKLVQREGARHRFLNGRSGFKAVNRQDLRIRRS
jgi:hypothetical protein